MCPNPEKNVIKNPVRQADPSFSACLVEGDPAQRAREHRLRRRSLLISITLQIAALAALLLAPIFSKTERIALANNWTPMPPYRPHANVEHPARQPHPVDPAHRFHFCLTCTPDLPPVRPAAQTEASKQSIGETDFLQSAGAPSSCAECAGLTTNSNPQPLPPPVAAPRRVSIGHIDPATLIHRVEPVFPVLARQTHREGTVELHAIIATDGSVRSLQYVSGDAMFYPSALDAVSQWRYKPTYLNGIAVEVDTHITVIYRLNR